MATSNEKKNDQPASRTDDAGEAEMQAQFDQEDAQGYRGTVADPTPNSAYTVAGVTGGEATPETDDKAADEAAALRADYDKKGGAR